MCINLFAKNMKLSTEINLKEQYNKYQMQNVWTFNSWFSLILFKFFLKMAFVEVRGLRMQLKYFWSVQKS